MGRHLAETTRLLNWRHANLVFALLALVSASSAMALPGPAGQLTGFSSVLLVGALALLAGHAWGVLVIASAEVLILGNAWPIVSRIITHSETPPGLGGAAAIITTLSALPGLVLFAATLPFMVEVVIGRKDTVVQRPGEILSATAATAWLLQPLATML
ncbi:MAG: hypothetical protein GY811_30025 [Myxococcales bacterium]|nr:hypothetical protein [Myxococcales bacterium]